MHWRRKYDQLLNDYESYRIRIEEQYGSIPFVNREVAILRDKVRGLERELASKEVEARVVQNKYNYLREDYTSMRLNQISNKNGTEESDKKYFVTKEQQDLVRQNQELQDNLRKQEDFHTLERQ